jgi:uncharacterized membrane protein
MGVVLVLTGEYLLLVNPQAFPLFCLIVFSFMIFVRLPLCFLMFLNR